MRKVMAAPDADGWRDDIDREMRNLESHDVYELVPGATGTAQPASRMGSSPQIQERHLREEQGQSRHAWKLSMLPDPLYTPSR